MKAYVRRLAWLLLRLLPESLILELRRRRYLGVLRQGHPGESEVEVIAALLNPGDTCVDIGANFGVYTVALSRMVGAQGRVISVEPMPQTYAMLAKNLEQLGITNTQSFQCAVSDTDGQVTMRVPRWNYGPPNFYEARVTDAANVSDGVTIPSRRLDGILAQMVDGAVSFIKCDVEGHELSVLRGAPQTLADGPAWFIEVSGDPDAPGNANQVIEIFSGAGYETYRYTDGLLAPRRKGDQFINYFFLQPRHLQRLRTAGMLDRDRSEVLP